MLVSIYFIYIIYRLLRQDVVWHARVALFSRRMAGFVMGYTLAAFFPSLFSLIAMIAAFVFGEWTAFEYAKQRNLPGAGHGRLTLY